MKKVIGVIVLSGIALFIAGCGAKSDPGVDAGLDNASYQKAYAQWEANKKAFDDRNLAPVVKQIDYIQSLINQDQRFLDYDNTTMNKIGIGNTNWKGLFHESIDLEDQIKVHEKEIADIKASVWKDYSEVVEPPSPSEFKNEKK